MTTKIFLSFILLFASIGLIAESQGSKKMANMEHDSTIVAIVMAATAFKSHYQDGDISLDLLESRELITLGSAAKIRADGYMVSFDPSSLNGVALRVEHASFKSTEYCQWTKSEKSFGFGKEATVESCRDGAVTLRLKA